MPEAPGPSPRPDKPIFLEGNFLIPQSRLINRILTQGGFADNRNYFWGDLVRRFKKGKLDDMFPAEDLSQKKPFDAHTASGKEPDEHAIHTRHVVEMISKTCKRVYGFTMKPEEIDSFYQESGIDLKSLSEGIEDTTYLTVTGEAPFNSPLRVFQKFIGMVPRPIRLNPNEILIIREYKGRLSSYIDFIPARMEWNGLQERRGISIAYDAMEKLVESKFATQQDFQQHHTGYEVKQIILVPGHEGVALERARLHKLPLEDLYTHVQIAKDQELSSPGN